MQNAPSPELRSQYKEQPIPGWHPYETDPLPRRVGTHGVEYSVPFWDNIIGRGQRYVNPHVYNNYHPLKYRHPAHIVATGVQVGKLPADRIITLDSGAKSITDVLTNGYSHYDEDYRRYILEKADMDAHRFLLKHCAALENSVLACLADEAACADIYADLLTCGAVRLFPDVTSSLAIATPEYVKTEEYVQRKNELIRNTVAAFLRRDRYYSTKQMDFYRRRLAHCNNIGEMIVPGMENELVSDQVRHYMEQWMEHEVDKDYFGSSGLYFDPHFLDYGDQDEWQTLEFGNDDIEAMGNTLHDERMNRAMSIYDQVYNSFEFDDQDEQEELAEDHDRAMLKCVMPAICPKPLDEWVHCITAAEGNESHCVRPYKRLLSCAYNFQFYSFADEDPYVLGDDWDSVEEDDSDHSEYAEHHEEDDIEDINPATDLGPHTGLFRTGLYRIFHSDPNTLPLEELEQDHLLMSKQLARLKEIRHRQKVGKL